VTYAAILALSTFFATIVASIALWSIFSFIAEDAGVDRSWWRRVFQRIARLAIPEERHQLDDVQLDLVRAGYTDNHADFIFFGVRATSALMAPVPVLLWIRPPDLYMFVSIIAVMATIGYLTPRVMLERAVRSQQEAIRMGVSTFLDMLLPAIGAGLGVDAALRYVQGELESVRPELASVIRHSLALVDAGFPNERALSTWYERSGVRELDPIAKLLIRAERSGVGVSEALGQFAELTRKTMLRNQEAEMAKVGPYLTVMAIIFIMPITAVAMLGPALMEVAQMLFPEGMG
jgi:tight adherence protein C